MNRNRVGFTLVELLVVITIIGILMGLLIPAVNAARETARRNQCNTQLKNFALAAIQYEGSKGQLPGYVQDFGTFPADFPTSATGVDPSDPGNTAGAVPAHKKIGTWAVALMPWLEAQPTYEHWTEDRYPIISDGNGTYPTTVAGDASGPGYHQLAAPNLPIFQCPSNPASEGPQGLNSYVSNNGMAHLTSAGATFGGVTFASSQSRANGAFNSKYFVSGTAPALTVGANGPAVRLDDFKDGQGNTILFSENVQALPWHRAGLIGSGNLTFADPAVDTEVNFTVESARYVNGMVWHYEDPDASNGAMAALWNTLETSPATPVVPADVLSFHKINGGGATVNDDIFNKEITNTADARDLARPSSAHVDGVNAGMADGGTRFIQESVDYRVYQALLNLRGKSSDVPWGEFILTDEVL